MTLLFTIPPPSPMHGGPVVAAAAAAAAAGAAAGQAGQQPLLSDMEVIHNARLTCAAYRGDLEELRRLAEIIPHQRIMTGVVNEDGWNVLMLSTLFCQLEIVEWLLEGLHTQGQGQGQTHHQPLASTAFTTSGSSIDSHTHTHTHTSLRLAMLNAQDRDGVSPVFLACYHNQGPILSLLLTHGANPNLQHKDGLSPLSVAIYRGHIPLVRDILLPHVHLNVDACDAVGGRTALYHSAFWGNVEAVRLLLESEKIPEGGGERGGGHTHTHTQEGGNGGSGRGGGADPLLPSKVGAVAVDIARMRGHVGCVRLFEEWERRYLLAKLRRVQDVMLVVEEGLGGLLHGGGQQEQQQQHTHLDVPRWLQGRAGGGGGGGGGGNEAWPRLSFLLQHDEGGEEEGGSTSSPMAAVVLKTVVEGLNGDMYVELMEMMDTLGSVGEEKERKEEGGSGEGAVRESGV